MSALTIIRPPLTLIRYSAEGEVATGDQPGAVQRIARPVQHPYHTFNEKVKAVDVTRRLDNLDPDAIIYSNDGQGKSVPFRAEPLPVGRIVDALKLGHIIPSCGALDPVLVGALVKEDIVNEHRHPKMSRHGYNSAIALCENQATAMPDDPWVRRLRFLFPSTIVFSEGVGVCVPMLEYVHNKGWMVTLCDITTEAIPGMHMLMF